MSLNSIYGEILNEHNLRPSNKKEIKDPTITLEGKNPTCGDDIILQLKVNDEGIIEDGGFSGSGCAISQASVDMMLDLVIGEPKERAIELAGKFMGMIKGTASEEDIEDLDEAGVLKDISHMPARVKCAVLGWHTMEEMLMKGIETEGVHMDHDTCTTENM
ncbi:MAG: SUF system NifU family Fe-S cluster assembly protein [Lachnospiraceae bacterium]|nr:SUF system NifU family Fe-S cluster assembly protein [Lachnospiraceae bacterium]